MLIKYNEYIAKEPLAIRQELKRKHVQKTTPRAVCYGVTTSRCREFPLPPPKARSPTTWGSCFQSEARLPA